MASLRDRGFTVVELTVATGLLVLLLSITVWLLLEAQARVGREGRRTLNAVAETGLDLLRADLRASSSADGIGGVGGLWSTASLELSGHPQGGVNWSLVDGVLRRAVYPPGSIVPSATRDVLHGVAGFRWRRVPTASDAVEIELALWATPELTGRSVAAGQRETLVPRQERYSVVLTPRNVGPRTFW